MTCSATSSPGKQAWIVGGAVRDELLGRPVVDLDVVCLEPERAARALIARGGDGVFPLSEQFGAWRVVLDRSRTVDFAPMQGGSIEADLALRDFTINAIAIPLPDGEPVDPFGGRGDVGRRVLRVVSDRVFDDDPLRLLRAVRFEDELGFRLDAEGEALVRAKAGLVTKAAGERILEELRELSPAGYERAAELGLLEPLGGRLDPRLRAFDSPWFRLAVTFGENLKRLPVPSDLRRFASILAARRAAAGRHRHARSTASAERPSRSRSRRSPTSGWRTSTGRLRMHGRTNRQSHSCAATSSASRPAPRSAGCWSSSRRSALQARSPRGRRHLSLSDDRWSRTATQLAELEERRRPAFTEAVRAFLQPWGPSARSTSAPERARSPSRSLHGSPR